METLVYVIAAGVSAWAVWAYNLLVRDKHRCASAWSDIDIQLKRRHDLIPKLVEAVKRYAAFEQATLTTVGELRTQAGSLSGIHERGEREQALAHGIHKLIALAESYPELKANERFKELQQQISEVENHIQYARRYYNGAVRNLNTRIDSFPDVLIARLFKYKPWEYFQADEQ